MKLKMRRIEICALIIFGLFYFSEGKPCPENTRPHKTRCEAFYKCMALSAQRHVWIPEKCEQGLIYEHKLGLCVLPADDWECTLEDVPSEKDTKLFNNDEPIEPLASKQNVDDGKIEVVIDSGISDEEDDEELLNNANEIESSGDGGELVELDGFLQVENRETEDQLSAQAEIVNEDNEIIEKPFQPNKSKIDPNLTAHLQRLSQLIDGLKQTYQNGDEKQTELRPDQLNAFLAHFNIQNKFNLIKPTIEAGIKEISSTPASTTTAPPEGSTHRNLILQQPSKNETLLQEHLSSKLQPETKVVLTNAPSKRLPNSGYSNSQIVVNRPEGSVLFALPTAYGNEQHYADHGVNYGHSSPKISEDTLKTVLELSKQMIATQNIPKVIPNPAYYAQPILQPLFLSASAFPPQPQSQAFSSYYNNNNNNQNVEYDDGQLSAVFSRPQNHQHKKMARPSSSYTKPGTTIIHNNVIPVHVTSTNSGEKELVDSYGQSIGRYPPLNKDNGNSNNDYQSQTINHHHLHSHNYENNFMSSITTVRPILSTVSPVSYAAQYPAELSATTPRPLNFQVTPSTITEYYTPSPHLNEHNANHLFQSNERYPTVQYGDIPRPIDFNRQGGGQQSTLYQQANPSALFPAQLDPNKVKIRPNAQKVESMEVDPDELGVPLYGSNQPQQQQQQQQQLLTYNYNNDKIDFGDQYGNSGYGGYAGSSSNNNKPHPYLPRPQSDSSSTSYSGSTNSAVFNLNKHKYPAYTDGTQLVNVGGNFISFDAFQNQLLPLFGSPQSDLNNMEVITCAAGVRQPNTTDCTRYYVCSKKDGKVLSYSCPPYTAFNAQTRICDAHTYSLCSPDAVINSYTVTENKRIQMEAMKALQDAKRRREQAIKAQNIANLLQQYGGGQTYSSSAADTHAGSSDSNENDVLSTYTQQAALMANAFSSTPKPSTAPVKKRKYYCKEGDKIADQTSINNYFVCYKNSQGMMKGHKMTCSKGLIFCPKTSMCTLASRCI